MLQSSDKSICISENNLTFSIFMVFLFSFCIFRYFFSKINEVKNTNNTNNAEHNIIHGSESINNNSLNKGKHTRSVSIEFFQAEK
jgi:hypothetical protein